MVEAHANGIGPEAVQLQQFASPHGQVFESSIVYFTFAFPMGSRAVSQRPPTRASLVWQRDRPSSEGLQGPI